MAYDAEFDLFQDTTNTLHKKVARAIQIASVNVINESPATPNHAERLSLALMIRSHPDEALNRAHQIMIRVLENSTIAAAGNAALDTDVQTEIDGLYDFMAGV